MKVFAPMRRRLVVVYAFLIVLNAGAWIAAYAAFHAYPLLLGTALLAFTLGLRHAVDADHIAAIDNVTRSLLETGRRPVSVGLYFSLGHSTIVVLLTAAIVIGAQFMQGQVPALRTAGETIGLLVSALFLFTIAAINSVTFLRIVRGRNAESGTIMGGLTRLLAPCFRLVDREWKMFPIGALFGLGFDTATEIGLLGIAAIGAGKGLPLGTILIFPLLFAAGMSLVDTTDGVLMLGAYGWASIEPERRALYNAAVTAVSVVAALAIGSIELSTLWAAVLAI